MRAALKGVMERGLAALGPAAVARRLSGGRGLILAYHNIVPDDQSPCGDRSLHLPRRAFAAQLDELVHHCEVLPLEQLLGGGAGGRSGRPRVAITFDDAYAGAVAVGLPELARRALPATMFVTPGFLGGRSFWWDAVAHPEHGMPDPVRIEALRSLAGRDEAVRSWAARRGHPLAEPPPFAVASDEPAIDAALAAPGLTLGSHTWGHPNLTALSETELDEELVRPMEWLERRYPGRITRWLSYPYGLHDSGVERAAERAGYVGGLAISGGWFDPARAAGYTRPRLNIPSGLSTAGFTLRAAGLLG